MKGRFVVVHYESVSSPNHEADVLIKRNIEAWFFKVHNAKTLVAGASPHQFTRKQSTP